MPPLQVETTPKKTVKKKPTSEPQPAVTKEASSAADADAPVVFSANRTPTDYAKVGSSVSVITEKDINAQSKTYLQDYLQQVPGVSITTTGGAGKTTSFRLRGFSQNYVKVLIDGMDISDPTGPQTSVAFENLLVGDVAQVEVLKGPQSTLYGGDAVAGVITIDTKYATRPGLFQSGGAEYGTYGTSRGAYSTGYADGHGSNVAFTVQGINTEGISAAQLGTEDDAYRNGTVSGRGELKVSDAVTVFFAGRAQESHNEYDTSSGFDSFDNNDTSLHAGRVGANISLFNGQFVNTIAVQGMEVSRDENGSWPAWYDGDRVKGEYRGVLSFNKQLALVVGTDWEQTGIETDSVDRRTVDVVSPYAQFIVEPIDGLVLTAGGRIDNHSTYGEYDTHRLTAAYLLPGTETRLHSSYGTGFRAPSLYELYSAYGNTDLTPETSEGWDAGVEQGFLNGRVSIGATYFSMDLTDRIGFVSLPSPPWGGYAQVSGVTKTDGVELTGLAKITATTAVNVAYTYTDSEEPDGTRVTRLPRHSFVVGLSAQPIDKLTVNVTGQYIADTLDNNPYPATGKGAVDDYFLLSAKAGYEVLPGTVAYVRGENLLDEDYVSAFNYNNPGLTVFGGVQFALPAN
ncbi:MAG: TonB-dependent receptor [Hyphomicrobium sp.]